MTAYTAKFSNGATKTLKNSRREYTHAWMWSGTSPAGNPVACSGFAGSRELAEQGMRSSNAFVVNRPKPSRGWLPKEVAAWKPGLIAFAEIVEVTRS